MKLQKDDRLDLLANPVEIGPTIVVLWLILKLGSFELTSKIFSSFVKYAIKVEYKVKLVNEGLGASQPLG